MSSANTERGRAMPLRMTSAMRSAGTHFPRAMPFTSTTKASSTAGSRVPVAMRVPGSASMAMAMLAPAGRMTLLFLKKKKQKDF